MNFRKQQLSSLIRNEVAKAIQRDVEFSTGVIASVTGVYVSDDLGYADIMISIFPSNKKEGAMRALDAKRALIQTILFKKIKIMSLPRLRFNYDPGPENAAKIEKIAIGDKENINC